ncbi:15578_t:CDS:2, partial [Funneliformis mosseae]
EVLEDNNYDKNPIESSLFLENTASSQRNTHVLEEFDDIPAPIHKISRYSDTIIPLQQDYRNLDDISTPMLITSRDSNALLSLHHVHKNLINFDNISAPNRAIQNSDTSNSDTSVRQVHENSIESDNMPASGHEISKNLNISVYQFHESSIDLDNISAPGCAIQNPDSSVCQVQGNLIESNISSPRRIIPKNLNTSEFRRNINLYTAI